MTPRHRVVVWPWLRRPGRILLREWLAITIGPLILAWRRLEPAELEHELEHVRQWRAHGPRFAARYLLESLRSWRAGTGWYRGNRFEAAARRAAQAPAAERLRQPRRAG